VSPCPSCPVGYQYRTSNGNSTRQSVQGQLRRRLKNGFTASLTYTYSKSIDDDAVVGGQGGIASGATSTTTPSVAVAQNWLNLKGERGLSTFDQRHLLNALVQYTSGQGLGGGSLMEGWRGTLLKEWTVSTTITAGSGLPETPIYSAFVPGTGVVGTIRPNPTGQNVHSSSTPGLHLNSAAYTAPISGQWGTAGRDSIEGPDQFSLVSSLARTFRLKGRYSMDVRADFTNTLNHPVFTNWDTTINNPAVFGLPTGTSAPRSVQFTSRLHF
jgi:trimeric autotransporter adhesin